VKYSTDLIHKFGQALPTVEPSPFDQEVSVPSVLSPVVVIPGPQRNLSGISSTLVQRDSFFLRTTVLQAPSAAAVTSGICTFGEGLWRVSVSLDVFADFTAAVGTRNLIELLDPIPNGLEVLALHQAANVPQNRNVATDFLFIVDGWVLRLNIIATGVGQNLHATGIVIASRLN